LREGVDFVAWHVPGYSASYGYYYAGLCTTLHISIWTSAI
jgi:hypothetical protein